ncbi:carbohydrate kinase family protein [Terriglobus tenax]|uniref:carbohydrate kinase family protein n=1 Tax=Terriglobus tenax TaxID=1111115 RepID=UPI0021E0EED1|nr:carbohydrate kinase family protein [Terriglobus tenax]
MRYDVTVIGEIYLDHVFSGFAGWPAPGSEVFTDDYTRELGGGAITTACALSLLGARVRLIGVVGEADYKTIADRLEEFGVSAGNLILEKGRTGVTVSISTAADRTFFTYRGVNDQLAKYLTGHPEVTAEAAQARHVHLALPLEVKGGTQVLQALQAQAATVSIDVGHHVDWLQNTDNWELMRRIDYVMPNEKESTMLAGNPEAYLQLCREHGVKHALVKLGAAGAVMLSDGKEYRAAPPAVDLIDTTGAGDAFDAGFIHALLEGLSPQQCLQHGCVCGALSTRAAGALRALPTLAEAEAALEEFYAT